jgi:hypothetical protein
MSAPLLLHPEPSIISGGTIKLVAWEGATTEQLLLHPGQDLGHLPFPRGSSSSFPDEQSLSLVTCPDQVRVGMGFLEGRA